MTAAGSIEGVTHLVTTSFTKQTYFLFIIRSLVLPAPFRPFEPARDSRNLFLTLNCSIGDGRALARASTTRTACGRAPLWSTRASSASRSRTSSSWRGARAWKPSRSREKSEIFSVEKLHSLTAELLDTPKKMFRMLCLKCQQAV